MRRFLGGIFGNTIASDISQSKASGVFDMNGQYYIKQEGGWLPPEPITATGGSKSTPGDGYIYHRFDTIFWDTKFNKRQKDDGGRSVLQFQKIIL